MGVCAPHGRELNGYDAYGAHRRGELAATVWLVDWHDVLYVSASWPLWANRCAMP